MADGRPLGSTADIALYNFPKTVPVPDGGAIVIRGSNVSLSDVQWKNPPGLKIFREILPFVKRGILRGASGTAAFPVVWRILRKSYRSNSMHEEYPEMPRHYYYDERLNDARMSSVTRFLLPQIDADKIIRLRRNNYRLYLDELRGMKRIEILHDELDDGICPLSFPLLIDSLSDFDVDDADELHVGMEYVFVGVKNPLAIRAGAWLDPAHKVQYMGDSDVLSLVWAANNQADDEWHYTLGFGMTFGGKFQVDLAADFSDPIDTVALSGVYRF